MPRRRPPPPLHIQVIKRTAYISGPGAWHLAEELGLPRMKCPTRKVLMISATRVAEFMAHARTAGRVVYLEYRS